jgi:predicted nucleic acid-binding protein
MSTGLSLVPGIMPAHLLIFALPGLRANLTTDAQLAAIAADNNAIMCSNDTGFARFGNIRWHNPLTA